MAKGKKAANALAAGAQELDAMNAAMNVAADMALTQMTEARKTKLQISRDALKLENLWKKAKDSNSRVHILGVDLAGALAGTVSFQAINWVFRRIAKSSTFFADNIDYWQSLPHFVLGVLVYWGELLTRDGEKSGKIFPGMPREIVHEWSKIFMILGLNNMWRAFSVRRGETQKQLSKYASIEAERNALRAQLESLTKKA